MILILDLIQKLNRYFLYFVKNKGYVSEHTNTSFFYVNELLLNSVEEERTITRASLIPSQKLNNDKHQLWIDFTSDRSMITG